MKATTDQTTTPPADAAATATVDARGQACPGPIVTLATALKGAAPGDLLELLATDRGSLSDVPAWAKISGNELVEQSQDGATFRYLIRKA
jgi:tRNA 2-thiouridine synthesizing protein A